MAQLDESLRRPDATISDMSRFTRVDTRPAVTDQFAARLSSLVIGQPEAAHIVAREIVLAEGGIVDPTKPRTTLLFMGLTGVGKTEMTEAIARVLYGENWQKHYKRIDCNQLQNVGSVTRLTGTSATWVGYGDPTLITDTFLHQEGGTVIAFDEVEKAHPDVWKALLTITDKASLTVFLPTGKKQAANETRNEIGPKELLFNNSIVIFTSNAGAEELQRARRGTNMGFNQPGGTNRDIRLAALKGLKQTFAGMPEFLGRIGERRMIVFNELQLADYEQIFDNFLSEINSRIAGRIFVSDALKLWVLHRAIGTGEYGARDLKDAINEHIVTEVAELRASGAIRHTTEIFADISDTKLQLFEGEEVEVDLPRLALPSAETKPTPRSLVEFEYGIPFQINPTEKGEPSQDRTVCEFGLVNNGLQKGRIKITEVAIDTKGATVVFYLNKRLYRVVLELDKVLKAHPSEVTISVGGETYAANSEFSSTKKGLSNMSISSWKTSIGRRQTTDLVFSWEDLGDISFLIKEREVEFKDI